MEQKNPTKVIFTIDTEHGCGGVPYKITGNLSEFGIQENYGISAMMDIFEKYDMRAVFFTNIYEHTIFNDANKEIIPQICKEIHSRKHEIGLHWHALSTNQPFFSSKIISKLNLEEQIEMIQRGIKFIKDCTGTAPISFRAGAYKINDYTLDALNAAGIKFDSSYWYGNKNNIVSTYQTINKNYTYKNVTEFPIISVINHSGKESKLDLDVLSLQEIVEVLHILRNRGFVAIQIMFHSFSFLKVAKKETDILINCGKYYYSGGDKEKKEKLELLCSYLQLSPDFEVVTFRDIEKTTFNFEKGGKMILFLYLKTVIECWKIKT